MELKRINPQAKSMQQETLDEVRGINQRLAAMEKDIAGMKSMVGFLYRSQHPNHKAVEEFLR